MIVLCKLMQLEVYLYSFEERYHQNTVSLFFESLLKLSEGGEMKKCWITQRWKRSMYKQKRVLTNHELYFCAQKDICILYLSIIFMASFSTGAKLIGLTGVVFLNPEKGRRCRSEISRGNASLGWLSNVLKFTRAKTEMPGT